MSLKLAASKHECAAANSGLTVSLLEQGCEALESGAVPPQHPSSLCRVACPGLWHCSQDQVVLLPSQLTR